LRVDLLDTAEQTEKKAFFSEEKNQKTFTSPPLPNYQAMACMLALAQT
jgi:hypothetical protein